MPAVGGWRFTQPRDDVEAKHLVKTSGPVYAVCNAQHGTQASQQPPEAIEHRRICND